MKRIGIILVFCALWTTCGFAVSRSSGTSTAIRTGVSGQHIKTKPAQKNKTVRVATQQTKTATRTATTNASRLISPRNTETARAAVVARSASETRTGAEYEQCKVAYFTCMDQFCQLKDDNYRRCSCSNRVASLQSARESLQQAVEQLNAFNENLDIVGKTAAQASAMNTASDGELALTKDNSASKALLTAILNSIRGTNTYVEHANLSDLNSIDLSFDITNSFGTQDVGQIIASYNGQELYSAVYPQCRKAVRSICNDASLQRAVNAYLMAIEQDCNTVQTAITKKQKETQAAIRESSSMLDMARAENHHNHNSDDIATCLTNVESAILSEEVCGFNYHKCLDNGEYIDVSTGKPITGVVDFYKLGTLLTFNQERNNADQNLAQNPNNRTFVKNFEKRVKQFAEPALNKCYDDADAVWSDYLNKAMLDIYYAQQSKVAEIKQGCFDFVSACYMNGSTAMTNAMQGLVANQTTTLNPNVLQLNKSLCADYIASCNNMFDGNIVKDYIDNRHDTDSLTACRAVAQQCFNNYGGTNYENFYYPSSGLFAIGSAPDWFALYEYSCSDINRVHCTRLSGYKSECAKQLADIDACSDKVEEAFGGFDLYSYTGSATDTNIYQKYAYTNEQNLTQSRLLRSTGVATEVYNQIIDILQTQCSTLDGKFMNVQNLALYSDNYNPDAFCETTFNNSASRYISLTTTYSLGKNGIRYYLTNTDSPVTQTPFTTITPATNAQISPQYDYISENMCPRDYGTNVDVQSWGACLCWENGGRRSNNGTSTRCSPSFPVRPLTTYNLIPHGTTTNNNNNNTSIYYDAEQTITYGLNNSCDNIYVTGIDTNNNNSPNTYGPLTLWPYNISTESDMPTAQDWCTANINSDNQVCPFGVSLDSDGNCNDCPFDWDIVNPSVTNNADKRCCPQNNSLLTNSANTEYCCPNGATLNSNNKCANGSTITTPDTPTKISSEVMGDKFPKG